jgi:hypothetical protein
MPSGASTLEEGPSGSESDRRLSHTTPRAKLPSKLELDRQDVAKEKSVVSTDPDDPHWIAFTSGEAAWAPCPSQDIFDQYPSIVKAGDLEAGTAWVSEAEEVLLIWIVRRITQSEKRAAQFRSLGRGWIFVQVSIPHSHSKATAQRGLRGTSRFKWWFEGVPRVMRNRQDEFAKFSPKMAHEVNKWTVGYDHSAELVFVVRGFTPGIATISRRRWTADHYMERVWAPNEEMHAAVERPMLTEEEREVHAKKAEAKAAAKKAKRERQKKKKAEASVESAEQREEQLAREREEGKAASDLFEETLRELKEQQLE